MSPSPRMPLPNYNQPPERKPPKIVINWLWVGIVMLAATLLVLGRFAS